MKKALPYLANLLLAGCAALPPAVGPQAGAGGAASAAREQAAAPNDIDAAAESSVGSTILPGRPVIAPPAARQRRPTGGNVNLNFPGVDVQAVAKAVLGNLLHAKYTIAPDLHTPITLQSAHPIPQSQILPSFEDALRAAGLALVQERGGAYQILAIDQAKLAAPVTSEAAVGFASEVVQVQFVNPDELRRLIEPVLPGVVTQSNATLHTLTLSGTEGQREAARNLVRQFDVNWLRGTSFALFVPRKTDSRLIVPELDKLLNADGAPTRGMIHLIAMDRINGILAVSTQAQYLEDTRRWVEILDQEGEENTRQLFVYKVQNGRSGDLAKVLASAFGQSGATTHPAALGFDDLQKASPIIQASGLSQPLPGPSGAPNAPEAAPPPPPDNLRGASAGSGPAPGGSTGASSGPGGVDVQAGEFQAKITSDETNNAVLVYATPRDYAIVEEALRKLDIPPYQVMIEAAITEVTLTDALRFGVQGLYKVSGTSIGLTESTTAAAPVQDFPGFSALYTGKTISAALNALEGLTTVKVISAPKLMVLNNQTASIEVGDEVPILTGSATSTLTSSAPIVNSVDYRDTGIILHVTPRVNSSGVVLLDMAQEVSAVVSETTSSSINSPTISTRKIATSVAVQDGEVIALGGLISDNRNDVSSGLPVLSRIPILGPLLFGNINNNDTRTELVVLLKPTVVRNVDDGRAITDELREKLQGLRDLLPQSGVP